MSPLLTKEALKSLMAFSWKNQTRPIVMLAPMAGYTDSAFRQIVKKICPQVICTSELTSVNAMAYDNKKTLDMLKFNKIEQPLQIQLFGNNPEYFAKAGEKLKKIGIEAIDINMGCPAKKIVRSEQGSALIKNPKIAGEIIKKLKKATSLPISVKTRLGYDKNNDDYFINFLKILKKSGADLITIHGRTKSQAYKGKADWSMIYKAKKILKMPIIGNGDVTSAKMAAERLKSPEGDITLDGIMIGRAAIGNPWILKETYCLLNGKKYTPPSTIKQKIPTIKRHFLLTIKQKGEKLGMLEMRKHFSEYIKGFKNCASYRIKIIQSRNIKEILSTLEQIAKIK